MQALITKNETEVNAELEAQNKAKTEIAAAAWWDDIGKLVGKASTIAWDIADKLNEGAAKYGVTLTEFLKRFPTLPWEASTLKTYCSIATKFPAHIRIKGWGFGHHGKLLGMNEDLLAKFLETCRDPKSKAMAWTAADVGRKRDQIEKDFAFEQAKAAKEKEKQDRIAAGLPEEVEPAKEDEEETPAEDSAENLMDILRDKSQRAAGGAVNPPVAIHQDSPAHPLSVDQPLTDPNRLIPNKSQVLLGLQVSSRLIVRFGADRNTCIVEAEKMINAMLNELDRKDNEARKAAKEQQAKLDAEKDMAAAGLAPSVPVPPVQSGKNGRMGKLEIREAVTA